MKLADFLAFAGVAAIIGLVIVAIVATPWPPPLCCAALAAIVLVSAQPKRVRR